MTRRIVLSRDLDSAAHHREVEDRLVELLLKRPGRLVLTMPHLYHVGEDDPLWRQLAETVDPSTVCLTWLYPRPARWLLHRHGIEVDESNLLDLGTFDSAEDAADAVDRFFDAFDHSTTPSTVQRLDARVQGRWYPVLDYNRCVHCGQCRQFCLFGVYSTDEAGRVTVDQPDKCKTGCPACSRICPRGAIVFPLYADEAVAGAPGRLMQVDESARAMFRNRTRADWHDADAADATDPELDDLLDDLDRISRGRS